MKIRSLAIALLAAVFALIVVAPAQAQAPGMSYAMLQKGCPTALYSYSAGGSGTSATQTYTPVTVGPERPDRFILVMVVGNRSTASLLAITSVVINGVSASVISDGVTSAATGITSNNRVALQMWGASVPTGTNITITVTYGAALATNSSAIGVFSLYDIDQTAAFNVAVQKDVDPAVATVNTPPGCGVVLAFGISAPITWTNAVSQFTASPSGISVSGALNARTAPGSLTVTSAGSNAGVTGIVTASFKRK